MSYFNHELFDCLIDTLPTDQSTQLRSIMESEDVLSLVSQEVDRSSEIRFEDVFFKELFRKVSDAPLGIDTAQVAVSSFLNVESENANTNESIRKLASYIDREPEASISSVINRIRRQVRKVLGPVPNTLSPRITSGATVDLKRNRSIFASHAQPSITFECASYLRENGIMRSNYKSSFYPRSDNPRSPFASEVDDLIYFKGAKLETVPKTAKTDRVIVKEPTVNISYQASIGKEISKRLSLFGLDIPTSAEKHRFLAKSGSLSGLLATVDLSAASDRIVWRLVLLLLPYEWYSLLDSLRSRRISIGEVSHELEMFSPAGNGFTFELETLIFYSIALVVSLPKGIYTSAPPDVSVFGDDIIIPTMYYDNLAKVFNIFGFVINTRKSFKTGLFRESCGGDYYNGINMRGYNLDSLPSNTTQWFSIINAVRRVCYYNNGSVWRASWCSDLWHRLIRCVPEAQLLFGPVHYGDTCINCEYTELYTIKNHRWRGEYIKLLVPTGGSYSSVGREISAAKLKGVLAGRLVVHESIRGHGYGYKRLEDLTFQQVYPLTLLTSTIGTYNHEKWIPYTLTGQATSDLDELIESFTSPKASFLRSPRQVIARNAIKRRQVLTALVTLMRELADLRLNEQRIVDETYGSFSLDF